MERTLTSPTDSGWLLPLEHIQLFLDGRLLFVPLALREFVEGRHWDTNRREIAYLVWSSIYSATKYDASWRYRSIHHKDMTYGSPRYVIEVRDAMIRAGFIQEPLKNGWLAGQRSKQFRAACRGEITSVVLENKSLADCKGYERKPSNDEHIDYTRHCLNQLEFDRATLAQGVQRIIANYKTKKEAKARKRANRGEKPKKGEGIRNAEEALLRLGKPLFELIHKTGRITRSSEKKGGRLFSPYAFLMKDFRPLFSFGGHRMRFADAVESQVNLLSNKSGDQQLIDDTCNRRFYQSVAEEFDLKNEEGQIDRNEGKGPFYKYAFSRYRPNYFLTPYMQERYPKADAFMREQKEENHRKASWLLQGYESRIFLDGVYRRIRSEKIPALTIHDGIATAEENAENVKTIVEEEFKRQGIVGRVVVE